jgi:hypothetical protein
MQDQTTVEVPDLGRYVQVRPIPPKLQRVIHAKATKGGKFDFQELMVWKLVYGLENARFTEAEAREITHRFTLRVLRPIVDRIDVLSGTDEHLRDDGQPRKLTEPVLLATAWLRRFPDRVPTGTRSRESHGAKPIRRRGSRRVSAPTRGDPGDDSDPEPPAARRCACGCGRPRQPGKGQNYHDPVECRKRHARDRKRKERALDREDPDRLVARNAAPNGRVRCDCHGEAAYQFDHRWICCACGRPKPGVYSNVNGRVASPEVLAVLAEEARRGGHAPVLAREWRTRPTRKLAAKLRKAKREWGAAA